MPTTPVDIAKQKYLDARKHLTELTALACPPCQSHVKLLLDDTRAMSLQCNKLFKDGDISERFFLNSLEGITISLQEMADALRDRHGTPMAVDDPQINVAFMGEA